MWCSVWDVWFGLLNWFVGECDVNGLKFVLGVVVVFVVVMGGVVYVVWVGVYIGFGYLYYVLVVFVLYYYLLFVVVVLVVLLLFEYVEKG